MSPARATSFQTARLAVRSVLWAAVPPGVVVSVVPWHFFGLRHARFEWAAIADVSGAVLVAVGVGVLAACIVGFARSSRFGEQYEEYAQVGRWAPRPRRPDR